MYGLFFIDLAMILLSYTIAYAIRYHQLIHYQQVSLHTIVCLMLMLVCVAYRLLINGDRNFVGRDWVVEFIAVFKYEVAILVVVIFALYFVQQAGEYSRLVFGYFAIINTLLTFVLHQCFKTIMKKYLKSEHAKIPVLLVAEVKNVEKILDNLKQKMPINYAVTAIVLLDGDGRATEVDGIEVIANRSNMLAKVKQIALDEVFISVENEDAASVRQMIRDFEMMGVICHYDLAIAEWSANAKQVGDFANYTVVTYSLNRHDDKRLIIKRMMDIAGGLVGLLVTAVLTPVVALAIKLESPGPVFFSQIRIGKNGRRFKIYKFRSMYQDAEARKKELEAQNEMSSGLMFKMENDPRITKVGAFIRKTSIDELPQFYNILVGDMSLVGTRPPTANEFEQYDPYFRRRLCMTPGLTGLWQVNGRGSVFDFEDVIKYDLEYIDNWSLGLDIKILLKTVLVVLTAKGAK
ncbi:MAG: sugar transferase [Lachnospiraceae bacterium]|nr:sugar transferase [Lachnospiraceae bacterium]